MLVKVWNENVHPYREMFRSKEIVIPPKDYIMMDEDDALAFEAAFVFPHKNEQGVFAPEHFKKIRAERPPIDTSEKLVCHANGQVAQSEEELKSILGAFKHLLTKDETAEAEASKSANKALKKENKELKSRVDRLESALAEHLGIKLTEDQDEKG